MDNTAYIKNLKISPKKLRFLIPEIKKLSPVQALDKLYYMPKKTAKILYQAIKSAINNTKSVLKTSDDLLKFKLLTVEEGRKLKRFQSGGRGTVKSILKRYSHIKIILTVDKPVAPSEKTIPKKLKTVKISSSKRIKKHGTKS